MCPCGASSCCGIISACAEQTHRRASPARGSWDHLRVCGADEAKATFDQSLPGSSPRVRSRLRMVFLFTSIPGIISACAEQTLTEMPFIINHPDHLRVCGADDCHYGFAPRLRGSSPRVRSRLAARPQEDRQGGIISACAEQTSPSCGEIVPTGDHLRVCGADAMTKGTALVGAGSSPRVRSRRSTGQACSDASGIISACAEQTSSGARR